MPVNVLLPPGIYYVGDISYVLSEEAYHWWVDENQGEPGLYHYGNGSFVVDNTRYGDGMYKAAEGSSHEKLGNSLFMGYGVDVGVIGIVSKDLITKPVSEGWQLGTLHRFTRPGRFRSDDGRFEITSGRFRLVINTDEEE